MHSYPQSKHSWTLLSERIAVKKLDKSSFLHNGTGIPKEFVSHFTSDTPVPEAGIPITLIEDGTEYSARLQNDSLHQRIRLFWKSDFSDMLRKRFPNVHNAYKGAGEVDNPPLLLLDKKEETAFEVTFINPPSTGTDWSDIELEATVIAYFNMLRKEQSGESYSKSNMNRQLREVVLSARNKQSIEYRMANISSVLEEFCHPTIKGYKSRGHVGAGVANRIKNVIEKQHLLSFEEYQPTADQQELEKKTDLLRKRGISGKPKGQKNPKKISSSSSTYERNPLVRAWVLNYAEGVCELCRNPAPFIGKDSEPFLEVHHVVYLADEGEDTIENAVALCPNCHRKAHFSNNAEEITDRIRNAVPRIKKAVNPELVT